MSVHTMIKVLKNKLLSGAIIGSIAAIFTAMLLALGLFDKLHLSFADSLYTLNEPSDDIIIIAIDKKTTQTEPIGLGPFNLWERDIYAELLTNIIPTNPRLIAFDVVFDSPNKYNPQGDDLFAEKIDEASNVLLPVTEHKQNDQQEQAVLPLTKFLTNAKIVHAISNPDPDGIVRRLIANYQNPDLQEAIPHLAIAAAQKENIPTTDNEFLVNYFADPFGQNTISLIDVLDGNFQPEQFADKIVLIGLTSSIEAQDTFFTPKSNEVPMPGVEVHANAIQTILEGKFLTNQSTFSQIITLLLLSVALAIVFIHLNIIFSILAAIAAVIGYTLAAHFFFHRGLILNMVYPYVVIVLTYIAAWVYRYFIADKDKRQIKSSFSKYLSKDLVNQIAKNPDLVKLGGEKRTITVLFSDIQGSTTHSEQVPIEAWVSQINEYFTVMEAVIQRHGGTLDKYEGDAIMAFWNAPINQADHIARAYAAALEMQSQLQNQLHPKWQKEGKPLLKIRIGINTGEALVGNFGSANRFDYTVMGDTINTASRLESSANKTYGTNLLVAGVNPSQISNFAFREIDQVLLPGKNEPVILYQILSSASQLSPQMQQALQNYSAGLAAYRQKDFSAAIQHFQKLGTDPVSKIMIERCQKLQEDQKISGLNDQMIFKIAHK